MNVTVCEVCSGSTFKSLFEKDNESYQQCVTCGLIRIYPQPSDERLNKIYNEDYPQIWGNDENVYRPLKEKLNRMIFNYIKAREREKTEKSGY
ncbi:MAG: hypothetical protein LBQ66_09015 [Planctomycetaceae bacterium]|jgi:hypothetical protein|nr:hypothetical protein [Planctomycetaceae bacterium]